jgi:hypothetical protein
VIRYFVSPRIAVEFILIEMNVGDEKPDPEEDDENSEDIDIEALESSRGNPESWFLETGEFSDVTIHCGRKTFRLHKYVLCRESKWFLQRNATLFVYFMR